MEAEDLKVGDRVRPIQRTLDHARVPHPATHSFVWRTALERASLQGITEQQCCLYVCAINLDHPSGIPRVLCSLDPPRVYGIVTDADWFADVDLVPAAEQTS